MTPKITKRISSGTKIMNNNTRIIAPIVPPITPSTGPMEPNPVLDRFDTYTGDIPVRTHHHRLPVEWIDTGGLTAPVALERLKYLEFVPDILVALLLHRNWMAVHLWVRLPYLCYPTRN